MSRRDVWAIAAIWFVVLIVVGSILGDNPTDGDEFYVGWLMVIVGSLMTGVYFFVRGRRAKKKKTGLPTSEIGQTKSPSQDLRSQAWWWGVVDVVVVLVLWSVGYWVAGLFVPDAASEWVGGLLPLAYLLVLHVRLSRAPTSPQTRAG